ncbi:putative ABC transporter ATP-binding protein [Azorhizobium caulinodans ORS 571]|uniref:Putative ABC transporter ATP-binding protein n=1 Tax=Azorhizobium caulinodans (strain ATCC 43989 / DSM 5975 / JCM 20966 / LMG 6465 / NBRC 14845 / NCIMB 13405 / ORS 571) TaxID=438753 RepID=A8IHR3_AZOC5|nr:ABC transporter ATP-binding protein/permease [Azorhizobium caulinodans]BAF89309.1 putative ABC transporter ATP-binding protein [Azorhizobium caulinodans ORS 571]
MPVPVSIAGGGASRLKHSGGARQRVVIAHRLSTVRTLDRLLVFDHGRIAEQGRPADLLRLDGGLYRRLHERQTLDLGLAAE